MHESEWSVTAEEEGEFTEKHSKEKKKVYSKYTVSIKVNCICMLHASPQGISGHMYSQILWLNKSPEKAISVN